MKKFLFLSIFLAAFALSIFGLFLLKMYLPDNISKKSGIRNEQKKMSKDGLLAMQAGYQFMKLKDPNTGIIPVGIRSRELAFTDKLPRYPEGEGQSWTWRGPANIGGRMLCIAIDVDNENHLLAGSASGGMWESFDQGQNWHKTTAPDAEQSATCIVQDKRPGKHNIWYYGTGEMLSTTDRNISTNARTIGIGNGIYKSTDNGATWQPLVSTQGGSPANLQEIFQGVWRIVTDPLRMDKDIVYAACYGAIMRSENGGASWELVLGDLANKSFGVDVAITSDGILYAALGSFCMAVQPPGKAGIWRSADGKNWKKITPNGFPTDNRVTRLALAPSNDKVMYLFTESQNPDLNPFNGYTNTLNTFWKMTWNQSSDSATWENRTHGIPGGGNGNMNSFPFSLVVYGGYCFSMGVKPDNENVVFIGGMNMYRSENGFADSLMSTYVGGYPYDMDSPNQLHPDQHAVTFLPSDPSKMFVANDGGIYITQNCMADSANMTWARLNNKLTTTQFYSIAIDHGSKGDDWVLGGLQDNNWYYTITDNPSELWFDIDICYDGFATAVARNWEYCVISAYSGNIWTTRFDNEMHTKDIFPQLPDTLLKYYDPVMGSNSLFPFYQNIALDPVTNATFYLPTVSSIWRKENMKAAAYDTSLRNTGWNHLSNVDVGSAAVISYLAVSVFPPNRVYYGTSLGKLFRLDNANQGNPFPVEITGTNFPVNAFISYIDVDPDNAGHVMVTFSNYGVQSLFHTTDGGLSWIAVGGNLEQFVDGTGNGPSIRCSKKLFFQGTKIIFAGTSSGLFSTRELNGDSTVWVKEGANSIGNVIVDDIDARQTDGFIAIGTHGNGVYSAYFNPATGLAESPVNSQMQVGNIFPSPVHNAGTLEIVAEKPVHLKPALYSTSGKLVKTFADQTISPGKNHLTLQFGELPAGIYYLALKNGKEVIVRKVVIAGIL
ncbi:MAG: T9SS type A sorting domain-containing protein [Bacteroidota bacterium]